MRRRLRTTGGEAQNLDSLLDTMTNVVGILIVVMAVTQLSVGGALERIRALASAEAALADTAATPAPATDASVAELDALRRQAAALAVDAQRARGMRALAGQSDAAIRAALGGAEARTTALRSAIARERRALEQLQLRLESSVAALPITSVRLPDPRTSPSGTQQLAVLCRHARCFAIDYPRLRATLQRGVEAAAGVPPALLTRGTDVVPIARHFDRNDLGDDNLRLRVSERGTWRLEWRDERRGESLRELRRKDSRLRRAFASTTPDDSYLTFFVWSDSFEAYLGARELAEGSGFAAGWVPLERHEELARSFFDPELVSDPTPID